jgi:hypothetical protein
MMRFEQSVEAPLPVLVSRVVHPALTKKAMEEAWSRLEPARATGRAVRRHT